MTFIDLEELLVTLAFVFVVVLILFLVGFTILAFRLLIRELFPNHEPPKCENQAAAHKEQMTTFEKKMRNDEHDRLRSRVLELETQYSGLESSMAVLKNRMDAAEKKPHLRLDNHAGTSEHRREQPTPDHDESLPSYVKLRHDECKREEEAHRAARTQRALPC